MGSSWTCQEIHFGQVRILRCVILEVRRIMGVILGKRGDSDLIEGDYGHGGGHFWGPWT